MTFRPRLWPTVITVVGVAILIGLGSWQLHRKAWKEQLLATIASRTDAAPVPLPAAIDDPAKWSFRRVSVAGRFDNRHSFWLYGRTRNGHAGIHLLVPLVRDSGPEVLVDRGFVPFAQGSRLVPYAPAEGRVVVEGVVRTPEPGGWFTPASRPADNIWYAVKPAAMGIELGAELLPVYVAAVPSGTQGWPAGTGGTERAGIRNEHLSYAIFWYAMAASLAVIYVLSSRSRRA